MDTLKNYKAHFPVFTTQPSLTYLDSAATTLIPDVVAKSHYHAQCHLHANVGKGMYPLSEQGNQQITSVKEKVKQLIQAGHIDQILFTENATTAIHLVAQGAIKPAIKPHHNIVVSISEHHANFLPWQQLSQVFGIELRTIDVNEHGRICQQQLRAKTDENTLLVALCHVSNVLGQMNDVATLTKIAKQYNATVLIDGAQAIAHTEVDVQQIGCDYYVFSGHKMYAGAGVGVLYCRDQTGESLAPVVLGGGIVNAVAVDQTKYIRGISKLRAGSANLAAIVALGSAIDWLASIGNTSRTARSAFIHDYCLKRLVALKAVNLLVAAEYQDRLGLISFTIAGVHSHDTASLMAQQNIAVRAGHHCAQPLHSALNIKDSVRISIGLYNSTEDIDRMITVLEEAIALLGLAND
ncbi:aminotransferase class V-fold PLP-dependent enzyme [Thalassotalea agarivorans]|uniref:Probable cysteine desulfurase n=1 Tax=Thalassotalea agarivorans TaxID=349064 RepID=A0A1H9ZG29_THASX|nr:aminotransferase class V-fold PLP-dependent enzyme [Thalassotalea agarivorans]SES80554.1 cysteine desulfurase / selenocysteine lyase [Thalassotalea agarivorans]